MFNETVKKKISNNLGIKSEISHWWAVKLRTSKPDDKKSGFLPRHFSRYETPKNQVATPVHQEKRKNQKRSPKIEAKDDQPIRENLEKNSVKNLSVKQIKEICDKNLQVRYNLFRYARVAKCPKMAVAEIGHLHEYAYRCQNTPFHFSLQHLWLEHDRKWGIFYIDLVTF